MCPSPPEDQSLRLFVAVDLPQQVREALGSLQENLRRHDLPDLRWVRPPGIHLTLKFLGETPAARVRAIREAMAGATRGRRRFRLALGEPGTFGGRRGARVLWVGTQGDLEPLARLQQRVEKALESLGFPPERRAFSPHLTLARVPDRAGSDERQTVWELAKTIEVPAASAVTIDELSLMRSILGPGGAVYERVAAFPLS